MRLPLGTFWCIHCPLQLEFTIFSEFVGPKEKDLDLDVSDDQIFKNRMSKSEISALPKFCNHESGSPSEVSVYNKQVSLRMIIKIQTIIRQHPCSMYGMRTSPFLYEHFMQQHQNMLIFLYRSCILTDFDVQGWASPSLPLEIDKRNKFIIYLTHWDEILYYYITVFVHLGQCNIFNLLQIGISYPLDYKQACQMIMWPTSIM